MKKLTFTILGAFIGLLTFAQHVSDLENENEITYNLGEYADKPVQEYKDKHAPPAWGGFAKIEMGLSPTHPRLFAGLSLGVIHRFVQLSVSGLPGMSADNAHLLNTMVSYRQPVNKLFTVVPGIGYAAIWDGQRQIKWTGGNHFVYGVEINKRVHNDLEVSVRWDDYRVTGKFYAMKVGTVGLRYIITSKKHRK